MIIKWTRRKSLSQNRAKKKEKKYLAIINTHHICKEIKKESRHKLQYNFV